MCGRFNITDHKGVYDLCEALGVPAPKPNFNVAPGAQADIVVKAENGVRCATSDPTPNQLLKGYWSMLMEAHPDRPEHLRPNQQYKTFNAQSRRLTSSSLWHTAYQQQRCIVPMSGFYEWKGGRCHYIQPADGSAFAMAGLYRQQIIQGNMVTSFSVITLPPQPEFCHIHDKSYPFALLPDEYELWLDNSHCQATEFQQWMDAGIRQKISIEPMNSPHRDPKEPGQMSFI